MARVGMVFTEDFLVSCFLFLDVLGPCIIKTPQEGKEEKKRKSGGKGNLVSGPNKNILSRPTFDGLSTYKNVLVP